MPYDAIMEGQNAVQYDEGVEAVQGIKLNDAFEHKTLMAQY